MALGATIYKFSVSLSDVDRGVYETLEARLAQHPSESDIYLVARVLAWAILWREDLQFGRGVSTPDEADIWAGPDHDIALWVEIGMPSMDRLTKMTKRAGSVIVVPHKPWELSLVQPESVFGADRVQICGLDFRVLSALAEKLERNNFWNVLISDGHLWTSVGEETFDCRIEWGGLEPAR